MKVMTIFGTRPEIIRLSLIIKGLDTFCDHILVRDDFTCVPKGVISPWLNR